MLNETLPMAVAMDEMLAAAKKAKRALTTDENALVTKVTALVNELVQVCMYTPFRPLIPRCQNVTRVIIIHLG